MKWVGIEHRHEYPADAFLLFTEATTPFVRNVVFDGKKDPAYVDCYVLQMWNSLCDILWFNTEWHVKASIEKEKFIDWRRFSDSSLSRGKRINKWVDDYTKTKQSYALVLQQLNENTVMKNKFEEYVEIVRQSPSAMKEYLEYEEKIDLMIENWSHSSSSYAILLKSKKMRELSETVTSEKLSAEKKKYKLEVGYESYGFESDFESESSDSDQSESERCPQW